MHAVRVGSVYCAPRPFPGPRWNPSTRSSPHAGSFPSSPTGACSRTMRSRSADGRIVAVLPAAEARARYCRARNHRPAVARADAGPGQCAHPRGHDPAARSRREPAAGAVAARRRLAARAPLGRPRVRARRHRTRDRRDAARRRHLLRRHAPVAGGRRADRRRVPHPRERRPRGDRGGHRLGVHRRRVHRPRHAACATSTAATR